LRLTLPPSLQAVPHEVARQARRPEHDRQQARDPLQDPEGDPRRHRLQVVVPRLHRSRAPGLTVPRELPDWDLGLGVDRDPERLLRSRRPLRGAFDSGADRTGPLDRLQGPGLPHRAQARAETVEKVAEGALTGRLLVAIAVVVDHGLADGLGGEACVGERGWGRGVALGVGFDEFANVLSQLGVVFFGGVSPALGEAPEAGDAGAELVEAEWDGASAPSEDAFGLGLAAVEVIVGDLGLEASPFGPGEESGGVANGFESGFGERSHGSPRLVKDTGRM
jgi:hypothetical protein